MATAWAWACLTGAGLAQPTVVMQGLDNPRGLAFGPEGALYVAEAGRGGDGPCGTYGHWCDGLRRRQRRHLATLEGRAVARRLGPAIVSTGQRRRGDRPPEHRVPRTRRQLRDVRTGRGRRTAPPWARQAPRWARSCGCRRAASGRFRPICLPTRWRRILPAGSSTPIPSVPRGAGGLRRHRRRRQYPPWRGGQRQDRNAGCLPVASRRVDRRSSHRCRDRTRRRLLRQPADGSAVRHGRCQRVSRRAGRGAEGLPSPVSRPSPTSRSAPTAACTWLKWPAGRPVDARPLAAGEPRRHPRAVVIGLDRPTSVAIGPDGAVYVTNHGSSPGIGEVLRVQ